MTFKIFLPSTNKIVDRSAVRSAITSDNWNLRANTRGNGENLPNDDDLKETISNTSSDGEHSKISPDLNLFQRGKKLLQMGRELFIKQELEGDDITQFVHQSYPTRHA